MASVKRSQISRKHYDFNRDYCVRNLMLAISNYANVQLSRSIRFVSPPFVTFGYRKRIMIRAIIISPAEISSWFEIKNRKINKINVHTQRGSSACIIINLITRTVASDRVNLPREFPVFRWLLLFSVLVGIRCTCSAALGVKKKKKKKETL
jgi:hypothetical protein